MKKCTFLIGCMLLCASFASADNDAEKLSVKKFPPPLSTVQRTPPKKQVLNDEKEKGVSMWAVTMTDYSRDPGFVHFYSGSPWDLQKTGIIQNDEIDPNRRWLMTGGTMHNGEYLGYIFYNYDMGYAWAQAFARVNLEEGTWEALADLSKGDYYQWETQMDAMATDPKTGKLMGVAHNGLGEVVSTIGEVDPSNGDFTILETLDEWYFAIEYADDGTLYAVRWTYDESSSERTGSCLVTLDPANHYAETLVTELTKDGQPFMMYFQNSLRFDRATGDLWILATNDNAYQYVCKLDMKTGVLDSKGSLGYSDIASGLYIPALTADAPGGAARVSNLTSSFDDNGIVTLTWTNPTLTLDKQKLTELAEVLVFRDGLEDENKVATLTGEEVKVGGEMAWTDETAESGVHTYYVVPCRVAGEKGVPDQWLAFTGRDVPGKPENVSLYKDGLSLVLSWTAPALGARDGWYDKSGITYTITRYPDSVKVAEGLTATEFTDNDLGEIRSYYYRITPCTSDGEGTYTESYEVLAGSSVSLPYSTNFETYEEAGMWTPVNANGDANIFEYSQWDPKGYRLYVESEYNSDDYIISPAFKAESGKSYKVTFNVYFQQRTEDWDPKRVHEFSLTAGQGATAEAQNIVISNLEGFQNFDYYETFPFEAFFTPETSGDYNVGLHYYSPEGIMDVITLVGASVEEVLGKDLAVMSLAGTSNPVKGTASEYTVTVKNSGSEDINAYKVQIVRLDETGNVVLGETEVSETLASQKETQIKVDATPDIEGDFQQVAVVVLEGDENTDNNTSASKKVTAAPEGTLPFNFVIDGDNHTSGTRLPISFCNYYSIGQSLYTADELNMSGSDIKIHRLAFEYDTNTEVESFDVQVYLGLSDLKDVGYDETYWTPLEEQTKVFEGKQSFVSGKDNMLIFNFDEPFSYDPTKSLVVTVCKEGSSSDKYPAEFKYFNDEWTAKDNFRSIIYENDNSPEYSPSYTYPYLPILHLAVESGAGVGIENVVIGGNGISFNNGTVSFNGIEAARLTVYDLNGRVVLETSPAEGQTSVNAGLNQGVYVVKVVANDGKVYTKKVQALK